MYPWEEEVVVEVVAAAEEPQRLPKLLVSYLLNNPLP
jgi:hypothetical protein